MIGEGRAAGMFRSGLALAVSLLALTSMAGFTAGPVSAQVVEHAGAASPRRVVTHHTGRFNDQDVAYTAVVEDHLVPGPDGRPGASVITIAYMRDGVGDLARRPVIFAFNGGPGASSSPLHLSALGPVRKAPAGQTGLIDNPFSPLDAADIVFIDPVGTGFSRALPGVDDKYWYTGPTDAKAVQTAILDWLKANGRETSPRYLAGESYGTTRAALIAADTETLTFDGVMLIALVGQVTGREMPFVASLPTMAAGAWHHQRIDRGGRTVDQVYDEALTFARSDYVEALIQGSSLAEADRRRIAERMSALIGLPVDLILAENLRISSNVWMFNLLEERGLRTGLLDVRVTSPMEVGALGALDDPSLGVVPKGRAGGPAPTPASIGPIVNQALGDYVRNDLGFATDEPYYSLNFLVNAAWSHGDSPQAMEGLAKALHDRPQMRLFWAAGYFDLTTPAYAGRYVLDQVGVPAEQLTAAYFAGPHGVYDGDDNLARFNNAVRMFAAPSLR
jgi:carboxypeptidase C (cathepsin A)